MNARKWKNWLEDYKTSLIIAAIALVNLAVISVCIYLDHSHKDYICGLEVFFCSVLEYRTALVSIFMTIWGIIITVTIFLGGKLDNLIYGISLREIISWRFCCGDIVVLSIIYCSLLPLMLISLLKTWPITLFFLLIIMLLDAIGFATFVLWTMDSDNIRELIKNQSLLKIDKILDTIEGKGNKESKSELELERELEQLPICILICNVDYENGRDRQYVLKVLEKICLQIKNRMVTGRECSKPQFHILLFPLLQKFVTYSGTKNLNKYRRTRILLCELLMRAIDREGQGEDQTKGWVEANILIGFIIIAAAIYSYPKDSPKDSPENDIYELLHTLPWEIRPFTIFLLLAFIEYLYAGGDINSGRLNSLAGYIGDVYTITNHDTYYIGNIRLYWHIWNHYNFGYWKEANSDYLKDFLAEYDKIRVKNYFGRSYVMNQIKYGERDTWRAF